MPSSVPSWFAIGAAALAACTSHGPADGPADGDDPPGGPGPGVTGHIAYVSVERIDGKLVDAVHVFDLATRAQVIFPAVDASEGGVTAARDGTLAHLGELDDAAEIRISARDGSTRASFVVRAELSFLTSGAAISPDATRVAFSFDVLRADDTRGARTYVCPTTGTGTCATFEDIKSPAWTPDGRLLAVADAETALFVSDPAVAKVSRVGPANLTRAENPIMTPDGDHIIFDEGDVPHLSRLDVATGAVTPLTTGGLGQFRAALSPDGKTLLYEQKCCGGLDAQVIALHAIPFTTATTTTPVATHTVDDRAGAPLFVDGRVGWF